MDSLNSRRDGLGSLLGRQYMQELAVVRTKEQLSLGNCRLWEEGVSIGAAAGSRTCETPPPPSACGDALEWAALLHDDSVLARFQDSSTMFLHASSARFIVESPDGKRLSQLTRFVTSHNRAKVRSVLDFRNYYGQSRLRLCKELLFESDAPSFSSKPSAVVSALWPPSVHAYPRSAEGRSGWVEEDPAGGVTVHALDYSAELSLAPTGGFFTVRYWAPLAAEPSPQSLDSTLNLERSADQLSLWEGGGVGESTVATGTFSGPGNPAISVSAGSHANEQADRGGHIVQHQLAGRQTWLASQPSGVDHMCVTRSYSTEPGAFPKVWSHPLSLARTQADIRRGGGAWASALAPHWQDAEADAKIGAEGRQHSACATRVADASVFGPLCETKIEPVEPIEASALTSCAHANTRSFPLLAAAAHRSSLPCASVVEWCSEALLRHLCDGRVEITSFRDSRNYVLSRDGQFLTCPNGTGWGVRDKEGGRRIFLPVDVTGLGLASVPAGLLPIGVSPHLVLRARSIQAEHASQWCCNQDLESASFSESKDGHTARVSALPLSDASGIAAAVHSHTMGRVGGSQASDSILDSSTSVLDDSVLHSRAQAAASRQQPRRVDRGGQYSATVIDSVSIPGLAVFTAFYDGRVRALFADRCIAEVDGRGETCSIMLPDGSETRVRVHAPATHAGVEEYLIALQQFGDWAFRSESERIEAEQELRTKEALIQHELLKIQRFRSGMPPPL